MQKHRLHIRESDVIERQATHILGTLGHVSEGKTTLIRSLTGITTHRHTREQERNSTIHLGYVNSRIYRDRETGELSCERDDTKQLVAHVSWVDCPGHHKLLATMLGGAATMDTACFVIAANQTDVPQPQTHEHLIAAELMGLKNIILLQNKIDLVTEEAALANRDKIRAFVADTCAESAPLFPIAAQHGWGIQRVLEQIVSAASVDNIQTRLNAPAMLTCVRSFDINRPGPFTVDSPPMSGAILGGTLEQGVLVVGDWIEIRPGFYDASTGRTQPLFTQVRGLRCDTTELPYAIPGALIAIATDLDPALGMANRLLGQRVGLPGHLPPIIGELTFGFRKLKRDIHAFGKHRVGDRLRICSGVATVEGTLVRVERDLTVRLDRPLCAGIGERISVLRFHPSAERELLEGAGVLRAIEEWADIVVAMPPEVHCVERTVEWELAERADAFEPEHARTYEEYLEDAQRLLDTGPQRLMLPDPVFTRVAKTTVWSNWAGTVALLDSHTQTIPYATHLCATLETELCTSITINGANQLILRGNWKQDALRQFLRKYVGKFKRCGECRGFETCLVKVGRVLRRRCLRCGFDKVFLD